MSVDTRPIFSEAGVLVIPTLLEKSIGASVVGRAVGSLTNAALNTYAIPFGNQPIDLYATFSLSLSLSVMTTDYSFILHRVALTIYISQHTLAHSRTDVEHVTQHRR